MPRNYGNAKKDGNHKHIVSFARQVCDDVLETHHFGDGFPDMMVAKHGNLYICEIKDPAQPPSKRRLTAAEVAFHARWGRVAPRRIGVVECEEDLLRLIDFAGLAG